MWKKLLITTLISIFIQLIFLLVFSATDMLAIETGVIEGRVTNLTSGEPLERVTVQVEGTGTTTLSNEDGRYRIRLEVGSYQLKFSHISHYSETITVEVVDSTTTRDISLRTSVVQLEGVTVYTRAYDPAQRIIVEAIRRKTDILARIHDDEFDAYTKVVIYDETNPDTTDLMLLAESQTTGFA